MNEHDISDITVGALVTLWVLTTISMVVHLVGLLLGMWGMTGGLFWPVLVLLVIELSLSIFGG